MGVSFRHIFFLLFTHYVQSNKLKTWPRFKKKKKKKKNLVFKKIHLGRIIIRLDARVLIARVNSLLFLCFMHLFLCISGTSFGARVGGCMAQFTASRLARSAGADS